MKTKEVIIALILGITLGSVINFIIGGIAFSFAAVIATPAAANAMGGEFFDFWWALLPAFGLLLWYAVKKTNKDYTPGKGSNIDRSMKMSLLVHGPFTLLIIVFLYATCAKRGIEGHHIPAIIMIVIFQISNLFISAFTYLLIISADIKKSMDKK